MKKQNTCYRIAPAVFVWSFLFLKILSAADSQKSILVLIARTRSEKNGACEVVYNTFRWAPGKTAVVICDMWNKHWCKGATHRVVEMAPHLNQFVEKAREKGVLIVHAPSSTMSTYKGHPARKRAQNAPECDDLPKKIAHWSGLLANEERKKWPIDQSDGGCDCDPRCKINNPWTAQIKTIRINEKDAISDSGREIWNLFESRGITNVMLLGVHTNMCVIGRPFGLRNMVRYGKKVVLVRDLTDTMYNSRKKPFVSHFTGTDLITDYIETFICPTILSTDLTGQKRFRFQNDRRKKIVFLSAESEYGSQYSLPAFAGVLELKHGFQCEILQGSTRKRGKNRHYIPCMHELEDADLVVLFVRRRALSADKMKQLKNYLKKGKPLIALRTSSHAFAPRGKLEKGLVTWEEFDKKVLGCNYHFYPKGGMEISVDPEAKTHPIVKGLKGPYSLKETMYRNLPLAESCKVILMGKCVTIDKADKRYKKDPKGNEPDQPVAWTNRYKGSKIFYTTLGSRRGTQVSFKKAWFKRLLTNAVYWALEETSSE